jgi:hypothetical protein
MRLRFLIFAALLGWFAHDGASAQGLTLTATGPASVTAGSTATLNVTLSGTSGLSVTGVQWSYILPTGINLGTSVISLTDAGLGKGLYCGQSVCLAVGFIAATNAASNAPFTDGLVATVSVAIPANAGLGATPLPLSGLFAANTSGTAIPIVSGATYSLTILPGRCDVNADGKIDGSDVGAMIGMIPWGRNACTVTGGCTVSTLVSVIVAALGGSCSL